MRQEPTPRSALTPAQRRQIAWAITCVVRRTFQYPMPPSLPTYPDAVPDLDAHIDELVRIIRENEPVQRAARIVKHSCPVCPHQYPARYCPLRPHGGCVLFRCAGPIADAVAGVLHEVEPDGLPHP